MNSFHVSRAAGLALIIGISTGLTACNEQPLQVETDWIHAEDPSPTPTASTTPTPTPTPTPTVSPSPIPPASELYSGPAEVESYVEKFVADAVIQGVNVLPDMKSPKLEIQIAKLDQYGASVIGLCETGGGQRRVTFDPDFWDKVSTTQKELLAHHELGHCILYRPHRSTLLASGAYGSIMYPIIMSSSTYTNNYDYYQQELFTQQASEFAVDSSAINTHICDQHGLE